MISIERVLERSRARIFKFGLQLLPRSPIWLLRQHRGIPFNRVREFRKSFRIAWRMIPLDARRTMLANWRNADVLFIVSPLISLVDDFEVDDRSAIAMCGHAGHTIEFDYGTVGSLIDGGYCDALIGLILHELAHVYGCASGAAGHQLNKRRSKKRAERTVKTILIDWGDLDRYDSELSCDLAKLAAAYKRSDTKRQRRTR